ncbi:leucine-rich_repeat domain-containing protein [Hexamita inflata]|uniref:Leucine-rich repeat domain-containing protein n=1 Tax=Hexamita inflata TaxID=28002 RepID=A0AA86N5H2_9EUKA|nr:leucine-rich repeat domain-containing protein [Hexamita inflata]
MCKKYQPAIQNQILTINGDNQIKDIKFIDQLPIVNLQLNNCINVNLFRTPTKILSLTINNSKLTNVAGIELMRQLQYLDIRDNSIISIQPLQHLVNLKQLLIDNNFIQDLQHLTALPNYTVDWIYYQKVPTDADYQNYINQLQKNQTVNELKTELLRFKNKTEEIIQNGPAKYDREMIAKYRGSVRTGSSYGPRLDINGDQNLRDLKFLEQLGVTNFQIQDCPNINLVRAPTNLRYLRIYNNTEMKMSSIKGIEKLTKLDYFRVYNCTIVNIDGIKELKILKSLYLDKNKIVDMSPAETLKNNGCCQDTYQVNGQSQPSKQEIDESWLKIM